MESYTILLKFQSRDMRFFHTERVFLLPDLKKKKIYLFIYFPVSDFGCRLQDFFFVSCGVLHCTEVWCVCSAVVVCGFSCSKVYRILVPCVYVLICVQLFATLWTVAHQAPLAMEFSGQEYWSRLLFPTPI